MRASAVVSGVLVGLLGLGAHELAGQTYQEINSAVVFQYAPPGARSMGMGGAFIGLADDATAAYSNPAGLTVLAKPEFSLEGRFTRFESLFTERGSEPPRAPTNIGIDTISGLQDGSLSDDVGSLPFASFVYPKGRIAVALYRHELVNYKASVQTSGPYSQRGGRFFPLVGTLDLGVTNYGLSLAFKASNSLSLGASVSLATLDLTSRADRYWVGNKPDEAPGGFFGAPNYAPNNLRNFQTQDGDGDAVTFSGGFVWKASSKFQIGGVYRQGADFEGDVSFASENGPKDVPYRYTGTSGFKVPDSFGAGLVFWPTQRITLTIDVQRVLHSQRLDYFEYTFGEAPEYFTSEDYAVDDATEVHFGLEYLFAGMAKPIALRAGAWLEPDSRIRYVGAGGPPESPLTDTVNWRAGEDQWHGAFGLGWVAGQSFQIDMAVDFSERSTTGTASAVFRF